MSIFLLTSPLTCLKSLFNFLAEELISDVIGIGTNLLTSTTSKVLSSCLILEVLLTGAFTEEVNTEGVYGREDAPITNLEDSNDNLILNVDFNKNNTDRLEDLTTKNKITYFKDFEISVEKDLRIKNNTLFFADPLEKNKEEQAF